MTITVKTRVTLWGRAASRCSFTGCNRELVMDATETDDESLVGDAAHIIGENPRGPRGKSRLTAAQRDKHDNLLLLCKIHHKQVDDQRHTYTAEMLQGMKRDHEEKVRQRLAVEDKHLQRDREIYATYVEQWSKLAHLDSWKEWTSSLLAYDQPSLSVEMDRDLFKLREYLFGRVWPQRYPDLEASFENFRAVLQSLQELFRLRADKEGDPRWTKKFYQSDDWDEERYNKLFKQYDHHVGLVQDLTLELTRAGNLVCDRVRSVLDPGFLMAEGLLTVVSGPHHDLMNRIYRPRYRPEESGQRPFESLDEFDQQRFRRDVFFGPAPESLD